MKRSKYIIFLFILLCGCTHGKKQKTKISKHVTTITEMVDVRIFKDGDVRINGSSTSSAGLSSHIQSMNISDSTKARFIFEEGSQTPLVYKATRLLHEQGVRNIRKIILSEGKFEQYLHHSIHIDILSTGKVLVQGNELFTGDLPVTFNSQTINTNDQIIITLTDNFSEQTLHQTEQTLDSLGFQSIDYVEVSEY